MVETLWCMCNGRLWLFFFKDLLTIPVFELGCPLCLSQENSFFFFFFFFFFFVFLPLLGPLPRHMEVPRLGVQSEL